MRCVSPSRRWRRWDVTLLRPGPRRGLPQLRNVGTPRYVLMNTDGHADDLHPRRGTGRRSLIRGRLGHAVGGHRASRLSPISPRRRCTNRLVRVRDWYLELAKLALQSPDADAALKRGNGRTLLEVLEVAADAASADALHYRGDWLRLPRLPVSKARRSCCSPTRRADWLADADAERRWLRRRQWCRHRWGSRTDVPHSRVNTGLRRRAGDAEAIAALATTIARSVTESVTMVASESTCRRARSR